MSDTATMPAPPAPASPADAGPSAPPWWRRALPMVLLYALSLGVALTLAALLVMMTGASPWSVVEALYQGSLSSPAAIGLSLDKATPLLIVALGTCIAARAGLFNIGQEGQLLIGAVTFTTIVLYVPGPGPLILLLALAGGAVGGALWAGIAAALYFWRGIPVVITTLLLVYISMQVVFYAVSQSWWIQEHLEAGGVMSPQSDLVPEDRWLPHIGSYPGLNFSSAFLIALILAVVVTVMLRRSTWGFRLRMLGMNQHAARRAGVNAVVYGGFALMLSGAFAGFAGSAMVGGGNHRMQPGISENSGWDGLLVALVARENPVLAVPVAIFFGMLRAGGGFLASTGVPRYIVDVVTALLVLAVVFPPAFRLYQREIATRRQMKALALATTGAKA